MLQWILQLFPLLSAGLIVFAACCLARSIRYMGCGALPDIGWVLERTPALDDFVMFVLQAVLVTSAVVALFRRVSNHIVQSLDILYRASLLLLVLYHTRKEVRVLPA